MDPYELPDPVVTASIYCRGRIDDVIGRCIAPLWQDRGRDPDGLAYLWMIRYLRGGEHLKVRIHAPAARTDELRAALEEAVRAYLDGLDPVEPGAAGSATGPADGTASGSAAAGLPAIDPEDEVAEPHSDRSLVWTRYRRSPVSFGGQPLVDDDRYAALVTRAMGHCTERVLDALRTDGDGDPVPFRVRQTALLKLAIGALGGVGWTQRELAGYLAYHRNWLLRYMLAGARKGSDHAVELVARLTDNAARWSGARQAVAGALAAQWPAGDGGDGATGDSATGDAGGRGLPQALHDVAAHVIHRGEDAEQPDEAIDPFAARRDYVPVFKVLNGAANQLGLRPLDEGFVYHFLLHLYAPHADAGFTAQPDA